MHIFQKMYHSFECCPTKCTLVLSNQCLIATETIGAMGLRRRWGAESRLRRVRPSRQNTSCRDCPLWSRGETVPRFWGACKPDTIFSSFFFFFFTVKSSQAIFISHIFLFLCWQADLLYLCRHRSNDDFSYSCLSTCISDSNLRMQTWVLTCNNDATSLQFNSSMHIQNNTC